MNNKIVVVLLIAAIIMSVFSMVITLGLNIDDLLIMEKTLTTVDNVDAFAGNIALNVGKNKGIGNG